MVHTWSHSRRPGRRVVQIGSSFLLLVLALLASEALLAACSSDDGTSGKRVVLHTEVELDPAAQEVFTTAAGWNVTLSRALVSTGAFYYFNGAPPVVASRSRRWLHFALGLFSIEKAFAHPGHYQPGDALGQMLEPSSIDLFDTPVRLTDGDGVTGTYRSARFSFSSPGSGPVADELSGHVALVVGMAERGDEDTRHFRAIADLTDVERSVTEGHVDGCEFEEVNVQDDGTVSVVVAPQVWFNLVDFSELEPGTVDDPVEFPDDSQPKIAFAQGLSQLSAYEFSYSAGATE